MATYGLKTKKWCNWKLWEKNILFLLRRMRHEVKHENLKRNDRRRWTAMQCISMVRLELRRVEEKWVMEKWTSIRLLHVCGACRESVGESRWNGKSFWRCKNYSNRSLESILLQRSSCREKERRAGDICVNNILFYIVIVSQLKAV